MKYQLILERLPFCLPFALRSNPLPPFSPFPPSLSPSPPSLSPLLRPLATPSSPLLSGFGSGRPLATPSSCNPLLPSAHRFLVRAYGLWLLCHVSPFVCALGVRGEGRSLGSPPPLLPPSLPSPSPSLLGLSVIKEWRA